MSKPDTEAQSLHNNAVCTRRLQGWRFGCEISSYNHCSINACSLIGDHACLCAFTLGIMSRPETENCGEVPVDRRVAVSCLLHMVAGRNTVVADACPRLLSRLDTSACGKVPVNLRKAVILPSRALSTSHTTHGSWNQC